MATTTNEDVVILVTACSRSLLPAERLRERTARNLRSNRHSAMNIDASAYDRMTARASIG
jgi:hypothetical protein